MTKEIIIDGIDVSECDYFEKQHIEGMFESDDCNVCIDNFCALCWKECEKHNGCYFKQLQRLKKENEELKERLSDAEAILIVYKIEKEQYKQALEEIREMLKKSMSLKSNAYNHFINVEKAIDKINEVLDDRD